jgi:hypothetical protein
MRESVPSDSEEYRQLNRSLTEKILDSNASDPAWKQQLLDDPQAVMRPEYFPVMEKLERMRESAESSREAEVVGHVGANPYKYTSVQQ